MPYRVPLFNELADHQDIDLAVIYYGTRDERRKATFFPDKRFCEIQCKIWGYRKSYTHNIEFPLSLYHDLISLRPDVVICAPDLGGLMTLLYSKFNAIKYIIWSEATDVTEANRSSIMLSIRKLIYSHAWKFIVPGAMSENYIRKFVPKAKIILSNNCIDENVFMITERELTEKFNKDILQITFSGTIIEDKGITFLIDEFNRLMLFYPELRDKCVLRILGTGPLELGLNHSKNIIFEGFVEGKKYIDFMKSSHVLILPSLHDCYGLVVIEALFAGNAIIVSDAVGSYPEAVCDNGMVIPSGSSEEVFKALHYIVNLPRKKIKKMALESLCLSKEFITPKVADSFLSAILN